MTFRSPALQIAPRAADQFRETLLPSRGPLATVPAATLTARSRTLAIRCPAFEDGGVVPLEYSCFGDNIHPELAFENPPVETASYALILRDIDSALEGHADASAHWVVWNIPAEAGGIAEGVLPAGAVVGRNAAGRNAYLGPSAAPGPRFRHYAFELYALDCTFALPRTLRCSELLAAIHANVLGTALYVGRFRRSPAALRRFELES